MFLNKLCELDDWGVPALRRVMKHLGLRPDFQARPERKHWEWAMGLWGLERAGCVRRDAVGLGIGVGHEPPLYYLAQRAHLVVATDLYGRTEFRRNEAHELMWRWPEAFAPFPYPRERLLAMQMDGADIPFGDDSFDFAFSFSSIEHFGSLAKIRRSMREVARVLRPGGVYALTTECEVEGPVTWRRAVPSLHIFTPADVERVLIKGSGLQLREPIDYSLSPATWRHIDSLERISRTGRRRYPHLIVEFRRKRFTSLILFLHKPT